MPNPKEAVNWCQSTVVSLSEVTEDWPLVSELAKNRRKGRNKFERCSKTLRSPWRAGGRGGRIDNLWNPTCWTVNRGRGSDLKPDKGSTEHIHVGATPGLIRFINSYLPENAEMQNWRGNVCYSLNKNKRWELSSKIETLFKESPEELASEDFEISIADLHCGNSKFKALYRNHGDNFTFFDRRTGRERTVIEGQPDEVMVKRAKSKVNGWFREIRGRGEEINLEKSVCIDLFRNNKDLRRYAGGRRVQKDHASDKYMREKVRDHGEPKSRKKLQRGTKR